MDSVVVTGCAFFCLLHAFPIPTFGNLVVACPGKKANITKIRLYSFDPHKSDFYTVKLGFTEVYIIFFLFLLKYIDCEYSARRFLQVPTIYVLSRNIKTKRIFRPKVFIF